jgi:hypothetical protein
MRKKEQFSKPEKAEVLTDTGGERQAYTAEPDENRRSRFKLKFNPISPAPEPHEAPYLNSMPTSSLRASASTYEYEESRGGQEGQTKRIKGQREKEKIPIAHHICLIIASGPSRPTYPDTADPEEPLTAYCSSAAASACRRQEVGSRQPNQQQSYLILSY